MSPEKGVGGNARRLGQIVDHLPPLIRYETRIHGNRHCRQDGHDDTDHQDFRQGESGSDAEPPGSAIA